MTTIWHRVDASAQSGLGHLLRQVAIVERAVERGHHARFVVDDVDLASQALLRFGDIAKLVVGASEMGLSVWTEAINREDIVIFDGYGFDSNDHSDAAETGAFVVAVDDRGAGKFKVDLLVDHNPTAPSYTIPSGAAVLHGLKYALVRREFLSAPSRSPQRRDRLLVAFGGSDASNLLGPALKALAQERNRTPFKEVVALVGPAAAVPAGLPPDVKVLRAPDNVASVHASADAALVTMGTTLWELLAQGVPTAVVSLGSVHRRISTVVAELHGALDAGDGVGALPCLPRIIDALANSSVRDELRTSALNLIDGHGAGRVLDEILLRWSSSGNCGMGARVCN